MELANVAIAPLVRQLPFDLELTRRLERFGWHPAAGVFTRALDLSGFKGALQKYKYIKIGQLGSGAYGVVHKAVNRETHELLAIKKLVNCAYSGLTDSTIREISMLRELQHDNVVRLKDIIAPANGRHVRLVLEFLDCDLRRYLDQYCEASEIGCIKSVMLQILRGLRHAHSHSIMHRDLKPQNVLVGLGTGSGAAGNGGGGNDGGKGPQIKIADFGLARGFLPNPDGAYTEGVVTLHYRAPELLLGSKAYTSAVDLWSVGCIMAEMVNFEPLFKSDSEIGLLFRIFERLGTPTPDILPEIPGLANFFGQLPHFATKPMRELVPRLVNDPAGLDLLSRLLDYDPRRRITARQALEHPWFHGVQV